jgi:ribulose-phosphate 3-epimerase
VNQTGRPAPRIAPSILASDFARLAEEAARAAEAGADMLHCDIMDGHFVPNLTFGPPVIAALRKHTTLHLDCHLMMFNAADYIDAFCRAGADGVTVHLEVYPQPEAILETIGSYGKVRGLSLNPDMPIQKLEGHLDRVDRLLIMSVFPGFGGQEFMPVTYQRVRAARDLIGEREIEIQVDGGVGEGNAAALAEAGVDCLVAGTSTFRAGNMGHAIRRLRGGV